VPIDHHRSNSRRAVRWLAVPATAFVLAFPATAAAAPGWELPQVSSFAGGNPELPNTTYATHCGRSQFGTYRFSIGVTERGQWGAVRFRVKLTADGAAHKLRHARFVGHMSRSLKRQVRQLVRTTQFSVAGGNVRITFRSNGQLQSSRPFNPRARRC
jgi:hypothetical protein